MSLNHSPAIVTDGLILCLDAANIRSYPRTGTTWTDLKGGNNGTLSNMDAANFSNDNAGSLSFDGTDEYVGFSDSMIDSNQDWTLSTFINRSVSQTSTIICGPSQSLQVRFDGTGYYEGHIKINHSTVAGVVTFTNFGPRGSVQRSLGVWYNVVITKSSYIYSLYIDGEFNQSVTDGSSVTFNNDPNDIGRRVFGSEYFNGKIANLSVYNRALTADEVRQSYEATVGRYT